MGEKPVFRPITINFKISKVIIYINTLVEEIRCIQRNTNHTSLL